MAHSLTIGRQIDLLGNVPLIDGPETGAVIRVGGISTSGFDLGAGEPQTTVITSLLLDGERPVGRRTGNATITIPLYIRAPGIPSLIAARERVLRIIDQEIWEMVLTLDGCEPTVFDCLRGKATVPHILREMQQDILTFSITCQRLPFGRSDETKTLTVLAPPGTPGGGGTSVLPTFRLDGFETQQGTTVTGTAWTYTTNERYGSSGVQAFTTTGVSTFHRITTSYSVTNYSTIQFWAAISGNKSAARTYAFTLHDNLGKSWALPSVTATMPGNIRYIQLSVSLKTVAPPTGFNTGAITAYSFSTSGGTYLDDVDVCDGVVNVWGGTRGGVYNVLAFEGSARAPVNVHLNRPAGGNITSGLIHQPLTAPDDYTPLIQLNPSTPLDNRLLTLPAPTALTVYWQGTYSVLLSIGALLGGQTTSRTVTITWTQFHASGGGFGDSGTVTRTYTPQEIGNAKYLYVGRITLPLRDLPTDSIGADNDIKILQTGLPAGTYDQFTDLILLDAEGSTVVWQNSAAYPHVWLDEPDPINVSHGQILNGNTHPSAESILDAITTMSGSIFGFQPGDNKLVVHCWDGAAQLDITYSPRWQGLRTN